MIQKHSNNPLVMQSLKPTQVVMEKSQYNALFGLLLFIIILLLCSIGIVVQFITYIM